MIPQSNRAFGVEGVLSLTLVVQPALAFLAEEVPFLCWSDRTLNPIHLEQLKTQSGGPKKGN